MEKNRFVAFVVAALVSLLAAGCQTTTNTNANGNAAVATNANGNANRNANANTNANANANRRQANANITRDEYERERESFAEEARRLGRTIGSGANDGWLWTKTRAQLAAEDDLRDSTINVDVDNAVVTLTGTVATNEQKARAGRVAQGVDGVRSVRNSLTVSAAGNTNRNANGNANRKG
jgi:hyperosmotically inducible protein